MRDGAQVLANLLDDLSFRSSRATQLVALQHIHAILADVCVESAEPRPWSNQLAFFLSLQNDFETNIVSRILSSGIVSASVALRVVDEIRVKGSSDRPTPSTTADVTALALSALQGMAFIHPRSKTYMGRKLSIQTLLDLLTALRHASTNPDDPDATMVSGANIPDATLTATLSPLACSVIDTLLCLLVDSPSALRVFEECNGLEAIVRTLKKVTGQQVRMKCLEFLYFYLQDEEVLAITGTPVVNLPPASASKSVSTPAKPRVPQTPRRPRTNQTPAKDRPRATPLSRTVSGDSTFSNSELCSTRSVSRTSTASHSSAHSIATSSSVHSATADPTTLSGNVEPERRFPRAMVMPSLSYSSSTVSSTSTNQTLDPHDPQQQSRPPTPHRKPSVSLSDECYVPLPESPSKPRPVGVGADETPKRRRDETPRAKSRHRSGSNAGVFPIAPLPKLSLFPTPAPAGIFGEKVPGSRSGSATSVGLSLLTGEIDYTPTSPKKTRPSKTDDVFASPRVESKPVQEPAPRTPKPVQELGLKPRHRPRASEILPRPAPAKTTPRNVSTPTTPTTPIESTAHASASTTPTTTTPSNRAESAALASLITPASATPGRAKRAVIPGGIRVPGRPSGVAEDLRKSIGAEGLRKSQSIAEGLRKSQVGSEALKRSQPSSEALGKSQASSEVLKKSQVKVEGKDKAAQAHRLKKSTSSTPVTPRTSIEENRKVAGEGARRSKESNSKENIEEAEPKRSIEMERRASPEAENDPLPTGGKMVRTSAEKKELLSAWLGNVDALVEGVQRAGVWGLR
ncbi:hypothetical protein FRC12_003087 [Ceratobasidium sp. 428]|nr:hypothetical protein FRC12_003087 [Ceratobasidium sp. 428]